MNLKDLEQKVENHDLRITELITILQKQGLIELKKIKQFSGYSAETPKEKYHPNCPISVCGGDICLCPEEELSPSDNCQYCKMSKKIRNPSGNCDHLYYPDNVNKEFKKSSKTLEEKLRLWLENNHRAHATANHWKQALVRDFSKITEQHYAEVISKSYDCGHDNGMEIGSNLKKLEIRAHLTKFLIDEHYFESTTLYRRLSNLIAQLFTNGDGQK